MKSLPVLWILLLTFVALSAAAQPAATAETFGTSSMTYLALSPRNFVPYDSTVTWATNPNPHGIYRTNSTGALWFEVGLQLPAGAHVEYLELTVCDNDPSGRVSSLIYQTSLTGSTTTLGIFPVTTDAEASPTCVTRGLVLSTPFTVDNALYAYNIEVNLTTSGSNLVLVSARIGYKLQISPAPASATFADVPVGSIYHRFVEALAAAGITGGCGGGNYCPDAPITRGQMAVFLSGALGLHWPN